MKSILDPTFRYTASFDTDVRRTFARLRREAHRGVGPAKPAEGSASITPIRRASPALR